MPLIITTNTYDLVQMYACHRTLTKDKKGWARDNNYKEDRRSHYGQDRDNRHGSYIVGTYA